jgi:small subunit ribosomal protein S20
MCDGFVPIRRVPDSAPRFRASDPPSWGGAGSFADPGLRERSGTIRPPAQRAFLRMPNIKQQKKRVRVAAQERLENLRYRSTVKTLTRRLEAAVEEGDRARVTEEHVQLQRWIDKAVSQGALHRNAGARKKAQAARLAGDS